MVSVKDILAKMYKDFREWAGFLSKEEYAFVAVVSGIFTFGAYLIMTWDMNIWRFSLGMFSWVIGFLLVAWIMYDENYKMLEGDQD